MITLDYIKNLPLDAVEWQYRNGYISKAVWNEYVHLWQTSSPRFEVQACYCAECVRNGPISYERNES